MNWEGLWYTTHHDVYDPSDDTFMLARIVRESVVPGERFLDLGCGTGLVGLMAARAGARVTCADRNAEATALAARNAKQNKLDVATHTGDLLDGLGAFDTVAFNPPYLPTADDEHVQGPLDWAFDGGPDGNAVVLKLASQLSGRPAAERPRRILVIHSSLSDPTALAGALADLGYSESVLAQEKHPYEILTVRQYLLA